MRRRPGAGRPGWWRGARSRGPAGANAYLGGAVRRRWTWEGRRPLRHASSAGMQVAGRHRRERRQGELFWSARSALLVPAAGADEVGDLAVTALDRDRERGLLLKVQDVDVLDALPEQVLDHRQVTVRDRGVQRPVVAAAPT